MRLNPAQAVRNARRRRSDRAFMKTAWDAGFSRGFAYASIEHYIAATYGPRCETTDLEDFPELNDGGNRCACCVAWELYDEWRQEHEAQS